MDYITQYWTDMCYVNNVEVSETVKILTLARPKLHPLL